MIVAGTILQNRYRVDRQIGEGGMGAVYIATDQRFNSTVAIKETFFTDQSLRKAFEREARLLNNLRHPALPRVSDHFIEDDGQFIVMEYIAGEDLSLMMDKKAAAFPLKDVLNWGDQLLDALDFLHTQEMPVIHRDIKPQNLKLTPRGQIILLDFGLAKGNPTDAKHQTAAKSVFGYSRSYASLEQIQGTGTDPRSDLYSLAATLYHLVTGIAPVDALTRAMKVLNGDADPLPTADKLHPQVTNEVAEVLSRAMALNGNHRPTSAVAMRVMLSEASNGKVSGKAAVSAQANAPTSLLTQPTEVQNVPADQATHPEAAAPTQAGAGFGGQATVSTDPSNGEVETNIKASFDKPSGIQVPIPLPAQEKAGSTMATTFASTTTQGGPGGRGFGGMAAALGAIIVLGGSATGLYLFKPDLFRQSSTAANVSVDSKGATANTNSQNSAVSNTTIVANTAPQNDSTNSSLAADSTKSVNNPESAAETASRKDQTDKTEVKPNAGQQKPADGRKTDVLPVPPATSDFNDSLPARAPEKPLVKPPSDQVIVTATGPDGTPKTRVFSKEEFEKLSPAQKKRIRSIILRQRQQTGHPTPLPTPP